MCARTYMHCILIYTLTYVCAEIHIIDTCEIVNKLVPATSLLWAL